MPSVAAVLARVLAARLQVVVPDGFEVVAHDGTVLIDHRETHAWTSIDVVQLLDQPEVHEALVTASLAVLNATQDLVSEGLRESWPRHPVRGMHMAPDARVEPGALVLRYAVAGAAAVELGTIPLDAFDSAIVSHQPAHGL